MKFEKNRMCFGASSFATAFVLLCNSMPAAAQVESTGAAPESEAQSGIADIIVTAQRKSENLQKVSVPVNVVSSEALLRRGATSPDALESIVPALSVSPTSGGRMSFFIRGVGNFSNNPNYDSAIAVNYDDVYIGRPSSTAGLFYDLARIEVLKGPQGTLYGRNATGGAINILPAPLEFGKNSGFVTASYGNYNAVTAEGAVNLAIGETGALRLSGTLVDHDGYMSDGTADEKTHAFRVQFGAELTPELTVRFSGDYAKVGGVGVGSNLTGTYPFIPGVGYPAKPIPSGLAPNIGTFDPASQAFRSTIFSVGLVGNTLGPIDAYPYVRNSYFGANVHVIWQTGLGTLTVIPAWRYADVDSIGIPGGYSTQTREEDEQYSVEARFNGNRLGAIDYSFGAIYFNERNDGALAAAQQGLGVYQVYDQRTESVAGFARVTAHLTERFRIIGGARYTRDKKNLDGAADQLQLVCPNTAPPFCAAGIPAPLIPFALNVASLPFAAPSPVTLPNGTQVPGIAPAGTAGAFYLRPPLLVVNRSVNNSRFNYRVAAEYDVGLQSMVYGSVETGFRAGGLQPVVGFSYYSPEKITAYTVGSKNRFLGNRLQVNVEGFLWKYKDQQLAAIQTDANGQQGFFVKNIGNSTMYGAELEVIGRVTPSLTLNANVQYLRSEYDNFVTLSQVQGPPPYTSCNVTQVGSQYRTDCSGKPAFFAPKWTVNLGIEKRLPLGTYELVASADTQYRSSRWTGVNYQPGELQTSTWLSNAQLSFGPEAGVWSIAAYVRNIEGDRFIVAANSSAVGTFTSSVRNAPRTYGGRLSYRF